MKLGRTAIAMTAVAGAATIGAVPAQAAVNLVTNGSFEGGFVGENPDGWNTINAASGSSQGLGAGATFAYDGTHYWGFSAVGSSDDALYQDVSVTSGETYDVSFAVHPDGGKPSDFTFAVDGVTLLDLVNPAAVSDLSTKNYVIETLTVKATSNVMDLSFGGRDVPGGIRLDDVSLTAAVPEPATWAVMLIGFGGVGGLLRRGRRAGIACA